MSTSYELTWLLFHTQEILINQSFKGLFVSDTHAGVHDKADDFQRNESLFVRTVLGYRQRGFSIIGLGDIVDRWENPELKDYERADLFDLRIKGNHDGDLDLPEALLFRYQETGKKVLCVHGHQGDFFNDDKYFLGKFFVHHIWRNLQMIGFHDPTTASPRNPKKHEATKKAIHEWSDGNKQIIIFGHTHSPECHPPYYYNTGSWVGEGGQAIEVIGEVFNLKTFV